MQGLTGSIKLYKHIYVFQLTEKFLVSDLKLTTSPVIKRSRSDENEVLTIKKLKTQSGRVLISDTGRNMADLTNTAEIARRYNVSSRAAAGVISAWLADVGLVSENDTRLIVDHKKVYPN